MNRLMLTTAALALIGAAAHAEETLSVYHWFEYMPQELVDTKAQMEHQIICGLIC